MKATHSFLFDVSSIAMPKRRSIMRIGQVPHRFSMRALQVKMLISMSKAKTNQESVVEASTHDHESGLNSKQHVQCAVNSAESGGKQQS